ncbi:hypothetical protein UFOVP119_43 [uncultured Caudovirales phage]|uniref:Uncharacterized protein n=1 Tax=uncultured Caudovirales phage TaxID=2100421 RepID=A0A6J5LFK5_9CAUD|nr:hypothetical protein UFOVP119_43 [uncultured Caudovirales phage]
MASGAPVVQLQRIMAPQTGFAVPYITLGASTPAEAMIGWAFKDSATCYLDYLVTLKGYSGGGLTLKLGWTALTASNDCKWQAAFRRIVASSSDLDTTAFTYDYNNVVTAAPGTVGMLKYDNITFTNGADMDSLADGESAILRIKRDPADGSDTLENTAILLTLLGYET